METRCLLWLFAAVLFVTGCDGQKRRDLQAEALADTTKHLEKAVVLILRLSKLSELTPAYEVANTLRLFTHELREWRREYMLLGAKMTTRGVSEAQQSEITKQYKATVEDLRTKVAQAERRLAKRSDVQLFYADLQRVREAVRDL